VSIHAVSEIYIERETVALSSHEGRFSRMTLELEGGRGRIFATTRPMGHVFFAVVVVAIALVVNADAESGRPSVRNGFCDCGRPHREPSVSFWTLSMSHSDCGSLRWFESSRKRRSVFRRRRTREPGATPF
jgi:hypothetical protein